MELEEELRVVGNNLKSLEVSEEKVHVYNPFKLICVEIYFSYIIISCRNIRETNNIMVYSLSPRAYNIRL